MRAAPFFARRAGFAGCAALLALALAPTVAEAQRDPAYAAARAAGQVGERTDGKLEALVADPDIRAMVKSLNIIRTKLYFDEAVKESQPADNVAFVAGCRNILRTAPGEKYQTPTGEWKTRTADLPVRDSRCV